MKDHRVFLTQIIITALLILNFLSNTYSVEPNNVGDLKANILLSDSPEYIKAWLSTPQKQTQEIHFVRVFLRGETIYASFVATGFMPNGKGNLDLHADYE